jgi:hypothetical protein
MAWRQCLGSGDDGCVEFVEVPSGSRREARCLAHATPAGWTRYGPEYRRNRERLLADGPLCYVAGCGEAATEADHIVPRVEGGSDDRLRPACRAHNRSAGGGLSRGGAGSLETRHVGKGKRPPSPTMYCA